MTAAVGADVEALCSKCGDVWHVVVAKVNVQVALGILQTSAFVESVEIANELPLRQ